DAARGRPRPEVHVLYVEGDARRRVLRLRVRRAGPGNVARGRHAVRHGGWSEIMSSLDRTLAGADLHFDLDHEIESVRDSHAAARTARTLVKDGPLRVTLTVMRAGGEIAEHAAEGP